LYAAHRSVAVFEYAGLLSWTYPNEYCNDEIGDT